MVVFVDLDNAFEHHTFSPEKPFPHKLMAPVAAADSSEFPPSPTSSDDERADAAGREGVPDNPNRNAFSAALSCYPYGPTPPVSTQHETNSFML